MTDTGGALQPHPVLSRKRRPLLWVAATIAVLVAGVALAVFAAVAALTLVLAAMAALLLRRRPTADRPVTLEGRRTPEGWVAEAASR